MDFKRARKDEQKAARRENILKMAKELCSQKGVMNWSLNELGKHAAVNKSNLYRYFGSREEILMTLMHEEMCLFVDNFQNNVSQRTVSIEDLSKIITDQYCEQPFLCELLCISASFLEHNTHLEAIKKIKLQGLGLYERVATKIAEAMNGSSKEDGQKIAFTSALLVSGLWPMASPSNPIRELSQFEGLEWLNLSFRDELFDAIYTYIIGLQAKKRRL
ncbi:Fatty acid metabolism regulator protein [Pseudovibrio sp. Ad13]|uniref:TetR family transcriptional regulator n=1 Tax=Pseudovibrio sp. Ad13 TaxID=989396 RepID=UPI0007AE664C|nr:TetR family transcriptional regulator [Pseudovibrio sp. Ad13]KZK85127.1 Fatty acid metabolism regulator protein [Pseudovibrio sp. Ad13]